MSSSPITECPSYEVERRTDGSVLVRVHSAARNGRQLPDAVFTFRSGDPQYTYWEDVAQASGGNGSQPR
jgi:hypothetical protein